MKHRSNTDRRRGLEDRLAAKAILCSAQASVYNPCFIRGRLAHGLSEPGRLRLAAALPQPCRGRIHYQDCPPAVPFFFRRRSLMYRNRSRRSISPFLDRFGPWWVLGSLPWRDAGDRQPGPRFPPARRGRQDATAWTAFRDAEILVVVFTCNHCPTAQAYEDRIKQLGGRLQGQESRPGGHFAQRSPRRCGWTSWATATWATASRT